MLYSYPGRCPGLSYASPLGYQYQQVLGLSNHSTFELLSKTETSSLNSMTLPSQGGEREGSFGCGNAAQRFFLYPFCF